MTGSASRLLTVVLVLSVCAAPPSNAQTAVGEPIPRVELHVAAGVLGGAGLGSADANLRANEPDGQPFRLFTTDSRTAGAPVFHLRAGLALSPRLALEGGLTFSRPDLRTAVTGDFEGAPPFTMTGRLDQYVFDAGVLMALRDPRAARLVPFAAVGAGYLRQLHEGRTVIEHGQAYHVGGGLKYLLMSRSSGFVRGTGVRSEARAYLMRGGVSFDGRPRPHLALSAGMFLAF